MSKIFNPQNLRLMIGLGNPGKEYVNTYHNVGHQAILHFIGKEKNEFKKPSRQNLFTYYTESNITFILTQTFMNESGVSVASALRYFSFKPPEILVVHDDADIELGKYKLQFGRGAAGHNGIKSIIDALGTNQFWRLRIGIRETPHENNTKKRLQASEFVLQKISRKNLKVIEDTFAEIKTLILKIL